MPMVTSASRIATHLHGVTTALREHVQNERFIPDDVLALLRGP
ncbi:hypothetical protein SAMN05443545_101672 [Aidingimonas halophila]|uniref:Uncharacterized protein n=1 Tax=Aidingimonas halophila TaxID=574349 RepID=A0A1H2SVW6_9GAMM|nr:hypothetical protein SAMN05443545_101672 [Aidingimonas halophila]